MGKVKHGDNHTGKRTRLYMTWSGMRARCRDPKHISYKNYGAKGIRVCDQWQDFAPFKEWALANGYREGLWIERNDPDQHYTPENCCWITPRENVRRAHAKRFKRYNIFDEAKTMGEWAEDPRCAVSYYTLRNRIQRGWPLEEALTVPTRTRRDPRRPKGELVPRIPSMRRA
jgi:hypothetical protein